MDHYLQLVQWKAKSRPPDHFSFIEVHRAIGSIYVKKGLFALGLHAFHRSIDVQRKYGHRLSVKSFGHTYRAIGQLFIQKFRQEKFVERLSSSTFDFEHVTDDGNYFQHLLGKQQKKFSKKEFSLEEISLILASLHWEKNDFVQTNARLQEFLQHQFKSSSSSVALGYVALGQISGEQGANEQSLQYFRSALALVQQGGNSSANRSLADRLEGRMRAILLPTLPY